MLSDHIIAMISAAVYATVSTWKTENGEKDIPVWDDADAETRALVTTRVFRVLKDPHLTDATFHNEWLAKMKDLGWTLDKAYDERRKTDPLLVPFHILPYEHQAKERAFRAVVLSLSRI